MKKDQNIKEQIIKRLESSPIKIEDISLHVKNDTLKEWQKKSRHLVALLKWLNTKGKIISMNSEQGDILLKAKTDDSMYYKLLENHYDFKFFSDSINTDTLLFVITTYEKYLENGDYDFDINKFEKILDELFNDYQKKENTYLEKYYKENLENKESENSGCIFVPIVVVIIFLTLSHFFIEYGVDFLQKITH